MALSNKTRLGFDVLEERVALSVTTTLLDNGTLQIVGDNSAEEVWITQNDDDNSLSVSWYPIVTGPQELGMPMQSQQFNLDGVDRIVVSLKGGDDRFTYSVQSGINFTGREMLVDLGRGNDTVLFEFAGPTMVAFLEGDPVPTGLGGDEPVMWPIDPPATLTVSSDLSLVVLGGQGHDTVDIQLGQIAEDVNVNLLAHMGTGNDSANVTLHGRVSAGAFLGTYMMGTAGNDALGVYSGWNPSLSEGATMVTNLDGGEGRDTLEHFYNGYLGGTLITYLQGGLGKDTLSMIEQATWDSGGSSTVLVNGGIGNDTLTLQTAVMAPPPDIVFIQPWTPSLARRHIIQGGTGPDYADYTPEVTVLSVAKKVRRDPGFLFGIR